MLVSGWVVGALTGVAVYPTLRGATAEPLSPPPSSDETRWTFLTPDWMPILSTARAVPDEARAAPSADPSVALTNRYTEILIMEEVAKLPGVAPVAFAAPAGHDPTLTNHYTLQLNLAEVRELEENDE